MPKNSDERPLADAYALIARLSSSDCSVAESAYHQLRKRIGAVKRQVFYAASRAKDSHSLSYLVELLGESRDPKYLPFISQQLKSRHARVRFFAHSALYTLGTPESREMHRRCDLRKLLFDEDRPAKDARAESVERQRRMKR